MSALVSAPASFLSRLTSADVQFERMDFETRSRFNARRQVLEYPSYGHWRLSVSTYPQTPQEATEWRAFKFQLRGRVNHFQCPIPGYEGPSTGYAGPIQIDGAGQSGFALNLKSLTPSAAILKAGDLFTIVNQCLVAAADVTANGSGLATVTFTSPLRTSPADSANVEIAAPFFLCASTDTGDSRWQVSEKNRQAFSFDGAEHIA